MVYEFEIEETLSRKVYAIADDEEEAKQVIYDQYIKDGDITLDGRDYKESNIYFLGELKNKAKAKELEETAESEEDDLCL